MSNANTAARPFAFPNSITSATMAQTPPANGNGGGGDSMEARVARLESSVAYIERDIAEIKTDIKDIHKDMRDDFRITFVALIAVALGLAGIMAKGFGWL